MRIELQGLSNTRDLGGIALEGGQVRSGLLFRSGQLFAATEDDLQELAGMNIGAVFDFRSYPERDEKPDPSIAGERNVHLPIIEDVRQGITRSSADDENLTAMLAAGRVDVAMVDRHMCQMYREFVTEPFANAQYARFLNELADEVTSGKAVLWHCTAGKDRAGFAAALVLGALGADRQTILSDYLQTNEYLAEQVDALVGLYGDRLPSDEAKAALHRFLLADTTYLETAFEAMDERYGTLEGFLTKALGVAGDKLDRMREELVV